MKTINNFLKINKYPDNILNNFNNNFNNNLFKLLLSLYVNELVNIFAYEICDYNDDDLIIIF